MSKSRHKVDLQKAARSYGIFLSLGHPRLSEETRELLKMELARLNEGSISAR